MRAIGASPKFSGSGHVELGRTELSADKLHACLQATLISAAILGVAMAEVGVSIQHDANHGAFSTNDCVGAALVSPSAATYPCLRAAQSCAPQQLR